MGGNLICIEGIDGTGKSTQFELLKKKLKGTNVKVVSFPQYDLIASSLLKKYLKGAYGRADAVNPYAASTFFAVDRIDSYLKNNGWRTHYQSGGHVLTDRYTTANAVHQAAKLPDDEILPFCDWLFDFEYNKLGLPAPRKVIYLNMEPEVSQHLIVQRATGGDIHEIDADYRRRAHRAGLLVAQYYGWHIIDCAPDGKLRTIEDIHSEICGIVGEFYNI
ncbi:MAG: deoxynucleoside kinase [Oscillospiraceae bacterium]|nr:deoxynucleoside kinase [Oscillospiraceae bacterium]